MKKYLVVATESELELPLAKANDHLKTIVTGVGGTNVIRALKDIPKDASILNVGYCGSSCFPVGSVLWVGSCLLWHPNSSFDEETFLLPSGRSITCFTSGDFVLDGEHLPPDSVVDMELAYIMAFGFAEVRSVKYVSDNLNYKQYEQTVESR